MAKKAVKIVISTIILMAILSGCAKYQEPPVELVEPPIETPVVEENTEEIIEEAENENDEEIEEEHVEEPMTEMYLEDYIVPEMDLSVTTEKLSQLSDEELEEGRILGDVVYTVFSLEVRNKETPGENTRLLIEKIGIHMTKRFLKQIEGELASEIEEAENEDNIKDKLGNIIEKREDGSVLRIDDNIKQGKFINYDVTGSHIAYSREIEYTIKEYADKDADKGKILREEIKPVFLWFKVEDGEIKLNGYGF